MAAGGRDVGRYPATSAVLPAVTRPLPVPPMTQDREPIERRFAL